MLPVVGDREDLEDVVILSEQTRTGASVEDKVIQILEKVGVIEVKESGFEALPFLQDVKHAHCAFLTYFYIC